MVYQGTREEVCPKVYIQKESREGDEELPALLSLSAEGSAASPSSRTKLCCYFKLLLKVTLQKCQSIKRTVNFRNLHMCPLHTFVNLFPSLLLCLYQS